MSLAPKVVAELSQSPLRNSHGNEPANAPPMEWNDEEEIDLAENIVYDANSGDDSTRHCARGVLQHGEPEVEMLVVPPYDELRIRQGKDRPHADGLADAVGVLDGRTHDLRRSWGRKPAKGGETVAGDQERLDPPRVMGQDCV